MKNALPVEYAIVTSDYAKTWVEDDVIHQVIDPSVVRITLEIAKQFVADRKEASGYADFPMPVLVTVNNAISVEKEAKAYYALPESYKGLSAIAMLMDNYIARMIGNLVFKINKQNTPTQFFTSTDKALLWLNQFKIQRLN